MFKSKRVRINRPENFYYIYFPFSIYFLFLSWKKAMKDRIDLKQFAPRSKIVFPLCLRWGWNAIFKKIFICFFSSIFCSFSNPFFLSFISLFSLFFLSCIVEPLRVHRPWGTMQKWLKNHDWMVITYRGLE